MFWTIASLAFGRLKSGLTTLTGVIRQNPWQAAVIALSVAFLWTLHGKHAAQAEVANMKRASIEAQRLAQAQHDTQVAALTKHAKEADNAYQAQLADARDATDRFIASHRMHGESLPGPATPASQGDGAAVPQGLPADSVVVASADVRKCGALQSYALAAHDWAVGLIRDGLGE